MTASENSASKTSDGQAETVLERGLRLRRDVLGDAYVDASVGSEFTRPLQELITTAAWGTVWAGSGLERATRSLVTVAMLMALGRREELRLHLGAAVRNGCTPEQLREVVLHAAMYCGMPAALDAMRMLVEVVGDETQRGD